MRVLHRRHDHACNCVAGENASSDRSATARTHGTESLPMQHAHAHPCGHTSSCRHDGGYAMSTPDDRLDQGRRRFMLSGALVVGFSLLPGANVLAQEVIADEGAAVKIAKETQMLAGSLKTNPYLDAWIKIDPNGLVTVFTGKVELGTGVRTALLQVAAEELDMAPSLIKFLTADTGLSPDEGLTAGSHTIADSGSALLNAAAQVRGLLVDAAAQQLGVDAATLVVRDARITAPDGRSMTYGDTVQHVDLHRNALPVSPLKDPKSFKVIGTSMQRLDIPAKVTGGVAYVQDMQLP